MAQSNSMVNLKVVTGVDSVSGVIIFNVTNLSPISVAKGLYDKVPFSFFTSNDTIDLTTSKNKKKFFIAIDF